MKKKDVALHNAVIVGDVEPVKALLGEGADVNARNEHDETPLLVAVRSKTISLQVVEALLAAGADAGVCDHAGYSVWDYVQKNNAGADLSREALRTLKTAELFIAMQTGNTEKERKLFELDAGMDVGAKDKEGRTLLHWAVLTNSPHKEELLHAGSDANARDSEGNTPLHQAVKCDKSPEFVRALLHAKADINAQNKGGETSLHNAVSFCNAPDTVRALLSKGACVDVHDKHGFTPLHLAASKTDSEIFVTDLIEAGANVHAEDGEGKTPLHLAALWSNNPEICKVLLVAGAKADALDKMRGAPLHDAVCRIYENEEVLKILIDAKADVNAGDSNKSTPLHRAANLNKSLSMDFLIAAKADIEARDKEGRTPLLVAAKSTEDMIDGPVRAIKVLLDSGADPGAKDNEGKTAWDHAKDIEREVGKKAFYSHEEVLGALEMDSSRSLQEMTP